MLVWIHFATAKIAPIGAQKKTTTNANQQSKCFRVKNKSLNAHAHTMAPKFSSNQ